MAALSSNAKNMVLILAMLVFGSWNTLNSKFQFQTCAPTNDQAAQVQADGCEPGWTKFNKPWVQNAFMFMGEASVILIYGASRRSAYLSSPPGSPSLPPRRLSLAGVRRVTRVVGAGLLPPFIAGEPRKTPFYVFAIPAFCDVFGTGLASVGMMYLDSAIWQMLRSSVILFSAVVSVLFLKRKLQAFHWVACVVVFCGLILVGYASLLDTASDSKVTISERMLGMGLVVFAQLCAAFQMVFEEKLLTGRAKTSAKKVVGMEGCWGVLFMAVALTCMTLLPGSDNGKYESAPDSIKMIGGSPMLLTFLCTFSLSIAVYNLCGITVGKKMSAVVRCLVDSCRTIVVWGMNLALYYGGLPEYGTPWTQHTYLTVIGFLVLVVGTLLYNEVLPSPGCLKGSAAPNSGEEDLLPRDVSGMSDILTKDDLTEESQNCQDDYPTAVDAIDAIAPQHGGA